MTVLGTMTLVGLLGLALHLQYYWAAAAVLVVFVAWFVWAKRAKRSEKAASRNTTAG